MLQRGLERREVQAPQRIGVDETSFQKRHEYVTVVNDLDGHVLHVADGRGKESLEEFYKQFDDEQLARIQTVAMDMWEPYIRVTTQYVADAQEKIAALQSSIGSRPRASSMASTSSSNSGQTSRNSSLPSNVIW